MQFFCFLIKICLENFLGFGRIHENKTFFFCFLKGEINSKVLRFFFKNILEIFRKKLSILISDLYLTV